MSRSSGPSSPSRSSRVRTSVGVLPGDGVFPPHLPQLPDLVDHHRPDRVVRRGVLQDATELVGDQRVQGAVVAAGAPLHDQLPGLLDGIVVVVYATRAFTLAGSAPKSSAICCSVKLLPVPRPVDMCFCSVASSSSTSSRNTCATGSLNLLVRLYPTYGLTCRLSNIISVSRWEDRCHRCTRSRTSSSSCGGDRFWRPVVMPWSAGGGFAGGLWPDRFPAHRVGDVT